MCEGRLSVYILFINQKILTKEIVSTGNMIVCCRKHFLDKRLVKNKHVFVSNIYFQGSHVKINIVPNIKYNNHKDTF